MKNYLPIILFVSLVAVIVIIGIAVNRNSDSGSESANNNESTTVEGGDKTDTSGIDGVALAKYLTSKAAIFYGAYWCSHCKEQKELFGDAFQYVTYYECDAKGENPKVEACQAAGIQSYPTWIINGQKFTGTKTFKELAEISGYPQP